MEDSTESGTSFVRSFSTIVDLPLVNPGTGNALALGFIDVSALGPVKGLSLHLQNAGCYYACPEFMGDSDLSGYRISPISNYLHSKKISIAGSGAIADLEKNENLEEAEDVLGKLPELSSTFPLAIRSCKMKARLDVLVIIFKSDRCYPFAFEKNHWSNFPEKPEKIVSSTIKSRSISVKLKDAESALSIVVFDQTLDSTQTQQLISYFTLGEDIYLTLSKNYFKVTLTDIKFGAPTSAPQTVHGTPLYTINKGRAKHFKHFLIKEKYNSIPTLSQDGQGYALKWTWWSRESEIAAEYLPKSLQEPPGLEYDFRRTGVKKLKLGQNGTASVLTGSGLKSSYPLLTSFVTTDRAVVLYQKFVRAIITIR